MRREGSETALRGIGEILTSFGVWVCLTSMALVLSYNSPEMASPLCRIGFLCYMDTEIEDIYIYKSTCLRYIY